METLFPYMLLFLGLLAGFGIGTYAVRRGKIVAERKATDLELAMLDTKSEISRLKILLNKLLDSMHPKPMEKDIFPDHMKKFQVTSYNGGNSPQN